MPWRNELFYNFGLRVSRSLVTITKVTLWSVKVKTSLPYPWLLPVHTLNIDLTFMRSPTAFHSFTMIFCTEIATLNGRRNRSLPVDEKTFYMFCTRRKTLWINRKWHRFSCIGPLLSSLDSGYCNWAKSGILVTWKSRTTTMNCSVASSAQYMWTWEGTEHQMPIFQVTYHLNHHFVSIIFRYVIRGIYMIWMRVQVSQNHFVLRNVVRERFVCCLICNNSRWPLKLQNSYFFYFFNHFFM